MQGDKQVTLDYFTTWPCSTAASGCLGMLPSNTKAAQRNDANWMGAYSGAMAQTPSDASVAEMLPGDLETARQFGERVARTAERLTR